MKSSSDPFILHHWHRSIAAQATATCKSRTKVVPLYNKDGVNHLQKKVVIIMKQNRDDPRKKEYKQQQEYKTIFRT